MYKLIIVALLGLECACTSVQNKNDLDLPLPDGPRAGTNLLMNDSRTPENLEPQQVFDWQRFYKKAPSADEKKSILANLQEQPRSTEDRLRLARNSMSLGRRQEARKVYQAILEADPNQFDAQLELVHLYLAEGETDRAFDYLGSIKSSLAKQEKTPLALSFRYRYALALTYLQSQNRKKGHDILIELIERDSAFLPAYGALAQSYLELDKLDVAEFISKRGLDQGSNEARLLNILAVISLKRNRLEDCKVWLQKALDQNSDFVPALINRANLAIQRREYAIAENDLKRAANLDPISSEVQISLGLLMKKTGRVSAAKTALERAVELDPQNAYARYHLATILSEDFKDRTSALQLFYDVLQADEKYSGIKKMAKTQIDSIRSSRLYER